MGIEQKIETFDTINSENSKALGIISHIAQSSQADANNLRELFKCLHEMNKSLYSLFSPNSAFSYGLQKSDFLTNVQNKIDDTEYSLKLFLQSVDISSLAQASLVSPAVKNNILSKRISAVTHLNPKLEGSFSPKEVNLSDASTPHDIVRFIHQAATEMFFDPDCALWDINKNPHAVIFCEGGLQFFMYSYSRASAGEPLHMSTYIDRFKDIAHTGRFKPKAKSIDVFYILETNNRLSVQFALGCHLAYLQIREIDSIHYLDFKLVDTTQYCSSKFRTGITEKIMQKWGYNVTRQDNILYVNEKNENPQILAGTFENLLRLSVSITNIDTAEGHYVADREQDVIAAFFHGVTNLADYIERHKQGTYADYATERSCYIELLAPSVLSEFAGSPHNNDKANEQDSQDYDGE